MRPEKSDFIIKIPDDITKQINKKILTIHFYYAIISGESEIVLV